MDDPNSQQELPYFIPKTVIYEKNSNSRHKTMWCCYMMIWQIVVSVGVVYVSDKVKKTSSVTCEEANSSQSPKFQRQIAPPDFSAAAAWSSNYLDQNKFYKGKDFIPWEAENSGATGIQLTNKSCFNITVGGVYNIYSKLTFEFTPQNLTYSTFHAINLERWEADLGKPEVYILEKNVISLPNVTLRPFRMFQPSQLFLLRTLSPGDVICVVVSDTSLIYHSKTDNTMNIYQLNGIV